MKTNQEFDFCAARLKALADRERLRIVQCLFDGPRSVGELAELLNEEIVKVSHHLGVLRNASLVRATRKGRFIIYAVDPEVLAAVRPAKGHKRLDLGCCTLDIPA
jgi:DNA-binding transcriptional ArsR family regulator